jgi:hypothetical protein
MAHALHLTRAAEGVRFGRTTLESSVSKTGQ